MASTKLNVLHWHAVDSQSWPFEIPDLPEITRKGAYSASAVYSLEDIKMIQSYAGERGISVLVEIDMPGHTASLASSCKFFFLL
jgi:hexosaminidase